MTSPPPAPTEGREGAPLDPGAERAASLAQMAEQARKLEQWRPPPPTSLTEPLPGEDHLPALADRMHGRHPQRVRKRLDEAERELLDLLRRKWIWPAGRQPPDAQPGGMSLPELDARHEAWCAVWATGETTPNGLPSFLRERRWENDPGPPKARKGRDEPAEWNPGSDRATLERLNKEVFGI